MTPGESRNFEPPLTDTAFISLIILTLCGILICSSAAVWAINARERSISSQLSGSFNPQYDAQEFEPKRLAKYSSVRPTAKRRLNRAGAHRDRKVGVASAVMAAAHAAADAVRHGKYFHFQKKKKCKTIQKQTKKILFF